MEASRETNLDARLDIPCPSHWVPKVSGFTCKGARGMVSAGCSSLHTKSIATSPKAKMPVVHFLPVTSTGVLKTGVSRSGRGGCKSLDLESPSPDTLIRCVDGLVYMVPGHSS